MSLAPLEKVVLELYQTLQDAWDHLEFCGYGDKWESECADLAELPDKIAATMKEAKPYVATIKEKASD